jgi:ATP-dependent Clp protease ATP-binding subunit ClpA
LNDLLLDKEISVKLTDEAVNHIIEKGYDSKMGARPLARTISDLIKVPLSKKILFEKITKCDVKVTYTETINFEIEPKSYTIFNTSNLVDENGYIILDSIK